MTNNEFLRCFWRTFLPFALPVSLMVFGFIWLLIDSGPFFPGWAALYAVLPVTAFAVCWSHRLFKRALGGRGNYDSI